MKRILMIFVSVLFIICLIGCNEEEKIEEINIKFVIEENIYDIKKEVNYVVNIDDIPNITEEDIEGIYYDSEYSNKYNNEVIKEDIVLYIKRVDNKVFFDGDLDKLIAYDIYLDGSLRHYLNAFFYSPNDLCECKRLNETSYIAGYLSSETIAILDNVHPVLISCAVSGIDDYIYRYQYAMSTGIISVEEHPIKYLYINDYEVELYYKDNRLIFILEKEKYSVKNIYDEIEKDLYFNFNVKYSKENETFKINKESTAAKREYLLFLSDALDKHFLQYQMEFSETEIFFIDGVKCISESFISIFENSKGEEYYEKFKEAIISTKNEYPYGEILIYDCEKWIEILKEE